MPKTFWYATSAQNKSLPCTAFTYTAKIWTTDMEQNPSSDSDSCPRNSWPFRNTEDFVRHSVELTIDPCPQPIKLHIHPSTLFPETALNITSRLCMVSCYLFSTGTFEKKKTFHSV